MQHKIIIEDLGQRIKEEEQEIVLRRAISGKAFDFNNYYPYEDVSLFTRSHVITLMRSPYTFLDCEPLE